MLRNLEDLNEALDADPLDNEHDKTADHAGSEDTVNDISVLDEEQRTCGQAVDQETAEHHGRNAVARDTENEKRDHGAADRGVIGGLCCDDTVRAALAEFIALLGHILGSYVSEHAGCRTADTRKDTDAGTDQSGSEEVRQMVNEFLPGEAEAFDLLDRNSLGCAGLHFLSRL